MPFMMQIKFNNFNNFIFYGVCLPQLGSVPAAYTPSWLAAVIGISSDGVISLRSLRCVRCVGWKPRLRKHDVSSCRCPLVMQRYIVQTIYGVDIGHIVSYRYRQEKYRNFDTLLSFRYRFNIGETTSMLSIFFYYIHPT